LTNQLPKGFSYEEEDDEDGVLPEGFSYEEEKPIIGKKITPIDFEEPKPDDPWYKRMYESFGRGLAAQSQISGGGGPEAAPLYGEAGKSYLSGATLGLTENVPGLKPTDISTLPESEQAGLSLIQGPAKITGELAPQKLLFKIFKLPGYAKEGASLGKKALNSLSNVLKASGVGASEKAIKDVFQGKVPDYSDVVEHGVTWGAIDAAIQLGGSSGRAIKSLLERNSAAGRNSYEILNKFSRALEKKGIDLNKIEDVAEEALSFFEEEAEKAEELASRPEVKSKNLRDKKVEELVFEKLEEKIPVEPKSPDLPEEKITEEAEQVTERELDTLTERAPDQQKLGSNTQKDVARRLRAVKAEYDAAYNIVSEASQELTPNANKIFRNNFTNYTRLARDLRTNPEDYQRTAGLIEDIFTDLGIIFERNADEQIIGWSGSNPVTMDQLMELGRRTGKLAKYGNTRPRVRDAIKNINHGIKRLIREELEDIPGGVEMWNEAEKLYENRIETFDNPTISKLREKKYKTEDVAKLLKTPTDLQRLKSATSPEQFKQIERELLSEMNDQSYDKAKKMYRELKRHMSEDSKKIADEILISKTPKGKLTPLDKKKKTEKWVADQISKPTKSKPLMDKWTSKKGNNEIRESLKGNPNEKEIIKYLEDRKLYESAGKWIKDTGEIDYSSFSKEMQDPLNRKAIESVAGKDGLSFADFLANNKKRRIGDKKKAFNTLKNQSLGKYRPPDAKATRGDEIIQKFKRKVEKEKYPYITRSSELWDNLSSEVKTALMVVFGVKAPFKAALSVLGGKKFVLKILKNPVIRNATRELIMTKSTNPWILYGIMKSLDQKED